VKKIRVWRSVFRLIPREEKFYTDFRALADELKRGSRLLEEMVAPDHPIWDKADEIKEVEHKCDFLTHGSHSASQPHVRDTPGPRRHPRARPLSRRCDGRD
jgi:hypothetical protein